MFMDLMAVKWSSRRSAQLAVLAAACVLSAVAFSSTVQATDDYTDEETECAEEETECTEEETEYTFRFANRHIKKGWIRCGSSGDWRGVPVGLAIDQRCSDSNAQTKLEGGTALSHTHSCSPEEPVMRIEYRGYYIGLRLRETLTIGCRTS